MKLGLRLSLLLLASAVFLVLAIASGVATLREMAHEAEAVIGDDSIYLRELVHFRTQCAAAARLSRLAAEGGIDRKDAVAAESKPGETLDGLDRYLLSEEQDSFVELRAAWDKTRDSLKKIEVKPRQASRIFEEEVLPRLTVVGQVIQDLEQFRQEYSLGRIRRINDAIETAKASLEVYALLLLGTMLILFFEIRYRLIVPIRKLESATEIIASGKLTHRITGLHNDELGELGNRFNVMTSKLEAAEKMKREFMAMVSHEMRTPLTSIGGFLGILLSGRRGPLTDRQREALDIVHQESQRLATLVEDLLDVASAESGTFRLAPEYAECAPFFTALMQPYIRQAEERKITFTFLFDQLPNAVLDARRLGQAIRNLLTNAFKFTPAGGRVRVSGERLGDELNFIVEDSGPGISKENQSKLFDRFYQVNPNQRSEGGVGLGLAIVREIARAHDGEVTVESVEGRGTTFCIRIPFRQEPEPRGRDTGGGTLPLPTSSAEASTPSGTKTSVSEAPEEQPLTPEEHAKGHGVEKTVDAAYHQIKS